jgi:predicted nucleic acid-binding protein
LKRVVDSSIWIEWIADTPLGSRLEREIPTRDQCVVPTIVQLELAKWLLRETSADEADQFIAYTQKCQIVPLDTIVAVRAADFCREFKLPTADAIVYATAVECDVELLTCDSHFEGLHQVVYFPKR